MAVVRPWALAAMPLAARAGVPYIVANPSATSISDGSGVGGNTWTFKVNPSDATMLQSLVAWLEKQGVAGRIAVLAENTDYGRGGAKALGDLLGKDGKALLSTDYFEKGTTDFTNVFARIGASHPSQLAIFAIGADTANLLNQYAEAGGGAPLTGRIQLEQIPKEIAASPVFAGLSTVQPWDITVDTPREQALRRDVPRQDEARPHGERVGRLRGDARRVGRDQGGRPDPDPRGRA